LTLFNCIKFLQNVFSASLYTHCVFLQAGEIALKFEPDRAQKVVQLVGPRLVEIGRCSAVSLYSDSARVLLIHTLRMKIM